MMFERENGKAGGKQLGTLSPPCFHQVVGTFWYIHGVPEHSAGPVNVVVSGKYVVGRELMILPRL